MWRSLRRWTIPCLASLALLLPACNRDERLKVAVVTNNPENFWNYCEDGARDAGEKFDVAVEFRRPTPASANEQQNIIDALLRTGVQGISISVYDPVNQAGFLDGVAAKAKLVTMDNDAPNSARTCYIGTDNYEAGRAVGRLVKECMPEGGTIAIFVGERTALNAQQRRQGVVDELAGEEDAQGPKFGKYEQFGDAYITDDSNRQICQQKARGILSRLEDRINAGDPVCLVGLWAYNPPAILKAAEEKKLVGKVHIVGFDEDKDTLNGITEGKIYGTVVQNPYLFGFESVRVLTGLARGQSLAELVPDEENRPVYHIPHRIFTQDGGEGRFKASEFDAEYDQQRERLKNS